ncbi:MAG: SDR family oxidoreductase [Ignavibacteria bacterium]|nr:SDR family oxidoreductase [Ignavibacteria bacterium]
MMHEGIFSLENKSIVVTGAAGLIGSVQCKALSDFGASVAVCDLNYEAAKEIADTLNEKSYPVYADVTDTDSLIKAKEIILSNTGRINGLVNNAAINDVFSDKSSVLEESKFENYPLELWNASINVNLTGAFLSCRIFGSAMTEKNGGSIINVASTYGLVGPDQSLYKDKSGNQMFYKSPAYPAGKGAIINFTRYLAAYWGSRNIRVNTLCPGGVEDSQDENFINNYSKRTMLGRMAKPEDYSGAVVFLAGDSSSYMTGACLVIDGGWTAW